MLPRTAGAGRDKSEGILVRGEILSYDDVTGTGLISGDDGVRYGFERSAIHPPGVARTGARVDFAPEGTRATQIMVLAGATGAEEVPVADAEKIDWKALFLSFNGRIRRKHFWIGWAVLFVLGILFSFFPTISFFAGLVLLVPHLAIGFKRFHDMGKPGWLVVIPWLLWYGAFGMMVAAFGTEILTNSNAMSTMDPETFLATGGASFGAMAIAAVISLGFWLWLGIGASQPGANKYGPNPKGE